MNRQPKENMLALTAVLGILAVTALGFVWSGFALSILWGWFMVPTFGLAPLSIPSAIGVSMVMGYITHQYQKKNTSDIIVWAGVADAVADTLLRPAMTLLAGWIVKQWI